VNPSTNSEIMTMSANSLLAVFAFILIASLVISSQAQSVPCIYGANLPVGCSNRIVRCGTTPTQGVKAVVGPTADTWCMNHRIYDKEIYIIQFNDRNNTCWEVKMAVGECWGEHPQGNGNYGCMGKCGAGCGGINCGAWARDCMRHDVCSWFFTSTDGASDPNCGQAYNWSSDDYLSNRMCTANNCNDLSMCK